MYFIYERGVGREIERVVREETVRARRAKDLIRVHGDLGRLRVTCRDRVVFIVRAL